MLTLGEFAVCLLAGFFVVALLFGAYVMCLVLKRGGSLLGRGAQALASSALQLKGRWVADRVSSPE
ncbi:MAG: hypothetical protein LAO21_17600 [Acidobacteriia bacterium]|nr:hypothetical protein [Terriglobia bacterium]